MAIHHMRHIRGGPINELNPAHIMVVPKVKLHPLGEREEGEEGEGEEENENENEIEKKKNQALEIFMFGNGQHI